MKIKAIMKLLIPMCVLATAALTQAQRGSFSLTWSTCDNGSATSAGAQCVVSATIGQPQAGTASGGNFTLASGFWPGALAEVRPAMQISGSGGNVTISWPASATGFSLQYCTDLDQKNWVTDTTPTFLVGTNKVVVESANGIRFYRLIKP